MLVLLFIGCDRSAKSPSAPTAAAPAATAPAGHTAIPATTQASTRPTESFMKINGRLMAFPRARLKVEDDGPHLNVLLFSDDPPQAIKDDYNGNSFYLQMVLDVADLKDLHLATWRHQARSQEREDTPFGIYLSGRKAQLQPYNVNASFSPGEHNTSIVHVWGNFLMWNNAEATELPQSVSLNADLPVQVEAEPIIKP
jgi:hypothetical protein